MASSVVSERPSPANPLPSPTGVTAGGGGDRLRPVWSGSALPPRSSLPGEDWPPDRAGRRRRRRRRGCSSAVTQYLPSFSFAALCPARQRSEQVAIRHLAASGSVRLRRKLRPAGRRESGWACKPRSISGNDTTPLRMRQIEPGQRGTAGSRSRQPSADSEPTRNTGPPAGAGGFH